MTTMKTPGSETLDQRVDSLKDSVRDFVHTGQDKVGDLADKAKRMSSHARDSGAQALDRTRDLIKDHPIAAVGIAFGAGYVLMRIARFF
jgi:ElaB/YqjD/DUF883 family membrane-anchored ribosome-binding protein